MEKPGNRADTFHVTEILRKETMTLSSLASCDSYSVVQYEEAVQ